MSRPIKNKRLFGKADGVKNPKKGRKAISRKISHLVKEEGKSQKEAVGQAFGMARSGDLGEAAKRAAKRR